MLRTTKNICKTFYKTGR